MPRSTFSNLDMLVVTFVLVTTVVTSFVVVTPSSPTFDVDVSEWNGANLLSVLPSRIYFVYSSADAADAMQSAIDLQLKIVVRSGRHQYTGLRLTVEQNCSSAVRCGCGGGGNPIPFAVVDVSNITGVQWSAELGQVRSNTSVAIVGSGERLFQVYMEASLRGYLLPGGTCPTVGISGFTLGGGYGFFGRKYSLTADSLVGVEMVLPPEQAGGAPRVVNVSSNDLVTSPLLWAMRGGGNNNFGIVTTLHFSLPPITPQTLLFTHVRLSITNTFDCSLLAMPLYDVIAPNAPQELYCQFLVYEGSCGVYAVVEGDEAFLNASFQLETWLRTIPTAVIDGSIVSQLYDDFVVNLAGCGTVAACMQRAATAQPDPKTPSFFGAFSIYVDVPLGSTGLATLYSHVGKKPPSLGFIFSEFDPYGHPSAVNQRGPSNRTAFPHRDSLYHIQFMVYWDNAQQSTIAHEWLASTFDAMKMYGSGSYRNYPSVWLPSPAERYYKENVVQLKSIKQSYDPYGVLLSDLL